MQAESCAQLFALHKSTNGPSLPWLVSTGVLRSGSGSTANRKPLVTSAGLCGPLEGTTNLKAASRVVSDPRTDTVCFRKKETPKTPTTPHNQRSCWVAGTSFSFLGAISEAGLRGCSREGQSRLLAGAHSAGVTRGLPGLTASTSLPTAGPTSGWQRPPARQRAASPLSAGPPRAGPRCRRLTWAGGPQGSR